MKMIGEKRFEEKIDNYLAFIVDDSFNQIRVMHNSETITEQFDHSITINDYVTYRDKMVKELTGIDYEYFSHK